MKVGILLCYGQFQETNEEYRQYVDWVVNEARQNGIEKLIISGGHTNIRKPEVSEAETIKDYLALKSPDFPVVLENESLTTQQNIEFTAKMVTKEDEVTIYCDLIRLAKVIWFALSFFKEKDRRQIDGIIFNFGKDRKIQLFKFENLTVKPFDFPGRTKYECVFQTFASLWEIDGIYDLSFGEKVLNERRKDLGLTEKQHL